MLKAVKAGVIYFLVVFSIGFVMGPVREYFLGPLLGTVLAVLVESPVLIGGMILGGYWIVKKLDLPSGLPRGMMGFTGLLLVLGADWSVGFLFRGMTTEEILIHYSRPEGLIYVGLLLIFLSVPVVVPGRVEGE